MTIALLAALLCICLAMTVAWAIQQRTRNSGWIDTIWSFAIGGAALLALLLLPADGSRRLLLAGLVTLWSLRLGWHILSRTRRSKDDPRYAALMQDWGDSAAVRLFLFLQIQALAGFVLVVAVVFAAMSSAGITASGTLIFSAVAILAVFGEGLADAQLEDCKRNRPANGICATGLWAYSRHPNYFFEWLFWLAVAGLAIAPPSNLWALLAIAAPLQMYALLRHGSGVPHLESHMMRTRPQAFAEYARRVPVFFPRLTFWDQA